MTKLPLAYLFVPGDRPDRFGKALATGADAVILDLEDAVTPSEKTRAREAVAQQLASARADDRARLVVRINDHSTPWYEADLQMLHDHGAAMVMLPKAEEAASVAHVRSACPAIDVLALIETARGVLNAEALATTAGVQRLVFGTIDLALDLDLSGDPVGFDYTASRIALASRAAGLAAPVAGVTPEIDDVPRLRADLTRSRAHGFGAKLCIHPKQVAEVQALLRPSATELDWAQRVLAAAESNLGAVQVDGRMVDRPVLQQAQRILARQTR